MKKLFLLVSLFSSVATAAPDVCFILIRGATKARIKNNISAARLSAAKVQAMQQIIGERDIINLPSGKVIRACLSGDPITVPSGTIYEVDREIAVEYGDDIRRGLADIGGIDWLTHEECLTLLETERPAQAEAEIRAVGQGR